MLPTLEEQWEALSRENPDKTVKELQPEIEKINKREMEGRDVEGRETSPN